MALENGSVLNNRYRIIDVLGQGGMGSVYLAFDENLGVRVAVKENLFLSDEYARQFRREANILASLRHPSLPRVGDHFEIQGQGQYFVMDYIEGEDLREHMERTETVSEEVAVAIGTAVCDALTYLHSRQPPVVHRDVKPGNIKITPDGQIILVDFGLAKVMQGSQATTTGARAMTPGYSPPEQYGTGRTDPRSDIYSLGATLYAALTGSVPEDGLSRATGTAQLTEIRKLDGRVRRKLAAAIEKALAVRPDARWQTAEDFKQALIQSLGNSKGNPPQRLTLMPAPEGSRLALARIDAAAMLPTSSIGLPAIPNLPKSAPWKPTSQPRKERSGWLFGALIVLAAAAAALLLSRGNFAGIAFLFTATPTASLTAPPPATQSLPPAPTSTNLPTPRPPTQTATSRPTAVPAAANTPSPMPTITPAPTALGGSSLIAYVSDQSGMPQIWLMHSDGTQAHQLSQQKDGACQPNWAPDGKRLIFITPCERGKRITYPLANLYTINTDGSGLTRLPSALEGDFDPAWSPDGKKIAFTSLRDGAPQIYLLYLTENRLVRISDMNYADRQPAWSPDGSLLAFVRDRTSSQIWITSIDGKNQWQFSRSGDINDYWPVWTPDGNFILFNQTKRDSLLTTLQAMRFQDQGKGTPTAVSPGESKAQINEFTIPLTPRRELGWIGRVSVSPDGGWIAFENWFGFETHEIFIMTINGADPRQLTDDVDYDLWPAWQPLIKP
jgi:serine/threonine protein kinase